MNTLLVGYDLNRPGQDYESLIEFLRSSHNWWHHLDSTWIVLVNDSPKDYRDKLLRHVDTNDELFVVEIKGKPAAWNGFNAKGSDWLQQNL